MVNTELFDYIKGQLARGGSKESIKSSLTASGGWNPADVEEAFSILGVNTAPSVPSNAPVPPISQPIINPAPAISNASSQITNPSPSPNQPAQPYNNPIHNNMARPALTPSTWVPALAG